MTYEFTRYNRKHENMIIRPRHRDRDNVPKYLLMKNFSSVGVLAAAYSVEKHRCNDVRVVVIRRHSSYLKQSARGTTPAHTDDWPNDQ